MTTRAMSLAKTLALSRVEVSGLIVTGILLAVNALLGFWEMAVGAAVGGVLVVASFLATKLIVGVLIGGAHSRGFGIFILMVKTLILVGIVVSLFLFTKINIYGFLIGVTAVVIVIIGENLRGKKNGTL
ncbi:MAG TPA: hypothetical protein VNN20_17200 [Thermodesulfobacteriota bacterium]|nr:hypothetical protein [Thermodesulfobacteriota bacterium]